MTSQARGFFTLSAHQRPMVGDIKMAATPNDHLGWMKCDGRNLPVSQYNQLYQVIGYSFTSNGIDPSLFGIPNAAGRVPGIVGTGVDADNVSTTFQYGYSIGEYKHQLVVAEMPSHTHTVLDPGHKHPITDPGHKHPITDPGHNHSYTATNNQNQNVGYAAGGGSPYVNDGTYGATTGISTTGISINTSTTGILVNISTTGISNAYTGGDQPHNIIQPTIVIGNMFIYSGYGRNASGVTDQKLFPYGIGTNLL